MLMIGRLKALIEVVTVRREVPFSPFVILIIIVVVVVADDQQHPS